MMFFHVTGLVLAVAVGSAPMAALQTASTTRPATQSAPRAVVADSEPLLTLDALTRMTTFWTAFMQEDASVRDAGKKQSVQDAGRKQHQKPLTITPANEGQLPTELGNVVDMVALSARYPSVAAKLNQAGLTAQQWEAYRYALFTAVVAYNWAEANRTTVPSTLVAGKNVEFLTTHEREFNALKATGMWFPKLRGEDQGLGGMKKEESFPYLPRVNP